SLLAMLAAPEPGAAPLAVGVDTRTRGFDAHMFLDAVAGLRGRDDLAVDLIFLDAEDAVLLRRYTETRRRHPLAGRGGLAEGIAKERARMQGVAEAADVVLDTSAMPVGELRALVERRCALTDQQELSIELVSFAFPRGLPREADMVFDVRFLRNPFYVPELRPLTGLDAQVAAYVAADPDYVTFLSRMTGLIAPLLPRMVNEGKKYLTIAVGCTGGQHRSVTVAERLGQDLVAAGWQVVVRHRELAVPAQARAPAAATARRI
ncbi:MAG: RNase adapter RapZ, partial [Acetobacteraceae bacterium]|nr:RNase adapter RapZ [Acetobacteraceae bacterium]